MPNHWVFKGADGRWVHRIDGVEQTLGTYPTQREAWEAAKLAARTDKAEAFLTGEDGRIRARNTYGRDPRSISG